MSITITTGGITMTGGGVSFTAPPPGGPTAGWFGGGYFVTPSSSPGTSSMIARITYATDTATASVRGPLSVAKYELAGTGNATDGWFGGGNDYSSLVQRITYATDTATASVRGPLSIGRISPAATGDTTNGWFGGGYAGPPNYPIESTVDRITYATDTATASVRGPLSVARRMAAAASNGQF